MSESPALLPDLKFHDLVFGRTLGTGAFSTVRYARRIVRDRTRSRWPEFAVKIVSTQRIEELGYEKSISREIAILRTLSHPGIARLVSSFRFRDGAYLVLEYGSGGDLHGLLKKNGSLDHESARFVAGEVVAALCSIHELGFVFADLKPENVLITESGHVKLTDFGGCRPVTDAARERIRSVGTNLLRSMRDGDWRESTKTQPGAMDRPDSDWSDAADDDEEDLRVEGTTAYLPPEVVVGGVPTLAADSWALGCVLYQCLSGRPPLLEDTDTLTAQKIVTFELTAGLDSGDGDDAFFGGSGGAVSAFRPEAKVLIRRLLHRNPHDRPTMPLVAEDDFFSGLDVFSLHKGAAHPLDVGSVAPVADAKWTRRQFSSIWAPQPRSYDIGAGAGAGRGAESDWREAPIPEGDERDSFFLSVDKPAGLRKITET